MPTVKISELTPIGATPEATDKLIINDGTVTKSVTVSNLHAGLQSQIDNLDTQFYTESEIGTFFDGTTPISGYNKANWDTAYGWGDHSVVGYLTSFTETDPIFTASAASGISGTDITNWNAAYGWGDHSTIGYLTSFTETDPVFTASAASGIATADITNWNTAYGWGDHAGAGYLTANQAITLSGDVSGSGTTSIVVTIADDSHNHTIANVDGLQTALDNAGADAAIALAIALG